MVAANLAQYSPDGKKDTESLKATLLRAWNAAVDEQLQPDVLSDDDEEYADRGRLDLDCGDFDVCLGLGDTNSVAREMMLSLGIPSELIEHAPRLAATSINGPPAAQNGIQDQSAVQKPGKFVNFVS